MSARLFSRSLRSPVAAIAGLISRFVDDTRGNIAVIFALTLPLLVGVTGLVTEYGYSLSVQANNQRTADLAAYAGALAYTSTTNATKMVNAGKRVGELNGIAPANVAVALVNSPRDATKQAVRAVVTVDNSLFLAPILGVSNTVRIVAFSYAEIGTAAASGCIIALDATKTGVTLSGGARISASSCAVSSNSKIDVPCGTYITAKSVTYNTTVSQPCTGITAETLKKTTSTDPLLGNAAVATARARFTTLAAQTSPAAPVVTAPTGGTSIDFAYSDASTQAQAVTAGCTASKSGSTWTLTCPQGASKVYNFANITVGGGINLSLNPSGTAGTTYNFSGPLSPNSTTIFGPGNYNFGGAVAATSYGTTTFGAGNYNFSKTLNIGGSNNVTFGAGTFNLAGGIITSGSSITNFGAGTFNMGRSSTTCNSSTFSVCNNSSGATTFAGPSTFKFQGGIANGGGSTLTMGSGTTNIFQIGASGAGDAINLGGGSKTYLADATTFELGGNLWGPNGGGSCLVISAAAQHDIRGNFNVAGAVIMGAGVYTIDGYYALGASGGGGSPCTGYTVSVKATGVNIVLSGKTTPSSGSCSGKAFCVAAGYSNIEITAPTTGTLAKLAVIGPSANTAGATFAEGGSGGKISGAFYFPNGPITMSGGAGIAGGSSCLQLIGSLITLSGGTTAASECIAASGGGSSRPKLVQ